MQISESGSVRVDLLGGTLDLPPINYILSKTVTLNLATSLKAQVKIQTNSELASKGIKIKSLDYQSENFFPQDLFLSHAPDPQAFGPLHFVAEILHFFGIKEGVEISLSSGSPPGAGLGGSSTMGVTLYKALCTLTQKKYHPQEAIKVVGAIESKILDKGQTGYQDYYPALYGGVLALHPGFDGVRVEQLYNKDLCEFLEKHLSLVYSGQTRLSGINNWEVYKAFFDRDQKVRRGMEEISELAFEAYEALKKKNFLKLKDNIIREGKTREGLFGGILTPEMKKLQGELPAQAGLKICGAGGGGCFLVVHPSEQKDQVIQLIKKHSMQELTFQVDAPLEQS